MLCIAYSMSLYAFDLNKLMSYKYNVEKNNVNTAKKNNQIVYLYMVVKFVIFILNAHTV